MSTGLTAGGRTVYFPESSNNVKDYFCSTTVTTGFWASMTTLVNAFSTLSGHDHDGTDGKPVPFVQFPAVQDASADANRLDDYEEGVWEAVLDFGGARAGMTQSADAGYYTKIGDTVFVTCRVTLTAKGTSEGSAHITGLPFTVKADTLPTVSVYCTGMANLVAGGALLVYASGTTAEFQILGVAGVGDVNHTYFTDTSDVAFTLVYKV